MKLRHLLIALSLVATSASAQKFVGGDISLLPEYEKAKASYFDTKGNSISAPLEYFKQEGMNAMRLRLFVDPSKYTGKDKDANTCQDIEYIKPLAKRIKDAGFKLMLDFHYSDTWADPAKQWTPADWASLTDEQLYQKIYDYTKDALQQLAAAGATPDFIQTGNEISYGMLWGKHDQASASLKKCFMGSNANWARFTTLLSKAIKACREVCPAAKIILHTERVAQPDVMTNFYNEMQKANVDYDIIGLSYYPYFHGYLSVLETAITKAETTFADKDIMIVETGYPYAWAVPGSTIDYSKTYSYSDDGQAAFTKDMIKMLNRHQKVTGLFWWWMEYNAKNTSLSGWYNAPLFDSRTGKATKAMDIMKDFVGSNTAVNAITSSPLHACNNWYTLSGQRISEPTQHGVYVHGGKKVMK